MTLRPDSIVHEVMYDPDTKKATGVKVIDRVTKESFDIALQAFRHSRIGTILIKDRNTR